MKGIILAGGTGTRLFPVTKVVSKQLLPVYDKPMIYYPLSVLMLAGIRDILIISTPQDIDLFKNLFGDGSKLGLQFSYDVQPRPEGLAQAFSIGESFIGKDPVCLILGDNLFYGYQFPRILSKSMKLSKGAVIFGYPVRNPEHYGVVEFDQNGYVLSLEEKPEAPKSNYAVPGLYFYDNTVVDIARTLKPSARGELEITDINLEYMKQGELRVELLGRGFTWLDTGTHNALLKANMFVQTMQERQGLMVACIEEIAYRLDYIDAQQLEKLAKNMTQNEYGGYLMEVLNQEIFTIIQPDSIS